MRTNIRIALALLLAIAALWFMGHSAAEIATLLTFGFGAALTADRVTQQKDPGLKSYPVAASTKTFAGGLVAVNSSGFAVKASDSASLKVVGVADKTVDNSSGANGDLTINVRRGIFRFNATSITQAMVGQVMYVVDDNTFDDALGTNGIKAGRLVEFISATEGWLAIDAEMGAGVTNADAGGTYTAAEQALINAIKNRVNTVIA